MLLKKQESVIPAVTVFLGIDISKEYFDVVILTGSEPEIHAQFENTRKGFVRLWKWINQQVKNLPCTVYACMEATGTHWKRVADWLLGKGAIVFVVNPKRINGYAKSEQQRSKTDKVDAGVIARFCRAQFSILRPWSPPREEVSKLQCLFRTRFSLVDARSAVKNQLKSGALRPDMQRTMRKHVKFYDEEIKLIEKEIKALLDSDPQFAAMSKAARSFGRGVGPITIAAIIGECRELAEFDDVKQITAFAGLDVREYSSGSSVRGKPRISKQGNSRLRRVLYMAAMQASKRNPALRPLYDRLIKRGLTKKAAVVACARKMLELLFVLMKQRKQFDLEFYRSKLAA